MRRISLLLAVLAGITLTAAHAGEGKTSFFNGQDLTGFEGLIEKHWSVKDGAIVGSTAPDGIKFNTFLCSKKKYKDFEMSFQVKLAKVGNSGIQIRSHVSNKEKFAVSGPQCDMGAQYWGSLYGENFGGMMKQSDTKLVKEILKVDDFNDYYIKCVGQHVTIKLNGKTTVDQDFDKAWADGGKGRKELPDEGIIAFQIHAGPSMDVVFRNIQFKELTK